MNNRSQKASFINHYLPILTTYFLVSTTKQKLTLRAIYLKLLKTWLVKKLDRCDMHPLQGIIMNFAKVEGFDFVC